jgi:hypothetical protein
MTPGTVKSALGYIAEFYQDIRTPESARKALLDDCVK